MKNSPFPLWFIHISNRSSHNIPQETAVGSDKHHICLRWDTALQKAPENEKAPRGMRGLFVGREGGKEEKMIPKN
jgi:hypothetical protein